MTSPPAKKFKLQGSLQFQGLSIAVENKPGSVRRGVGKDGKPWQTEMKHHYGYIRGTEGADGEEVDAYVGPDRKAPDAYVVHQRREDGTGFDEDKVMLGFGSKDEAERAFLDHYDDPKFLGPVSTVPVERLKEKVEAGGTLKKISSEPDMKKAAEEQGWWRGDPMSPGGVKFKTTFQGIPVHVDRPKGFIMLGRDAAGVPWARKYRYDYGFIPRTKGGDGDGLDVFLGPNKKSTEAYWAVQRKSDGSFDEYKVFLGFDNRDEAIAAYRQHIPKKLLGGFVAMKVDMMKAMLGMNAAGYPSAGVVKTAQFIGCLDELEKIGGVDAW